MTSVPATGVDLTAAQAEEITAKIRATTALAWSLVIDAYQGRAWLALGYGTWDEYCNSEFDGAQIRLPREERREVVGSLREAGLSQRAIAGATGVSKTQVTRDLAQVVPKDHLDEPERIQGTDGKTYTPPPAPEPLTPEQQREIDIQEGHARFARFLVRFADQWPYARSWYDGNNRDEIGALLDPITLKQLAEIEDYFS